MATGRPQRASASRMRRTTSACSACVPCEKLSRATSMPAAASRSRSATLDEAGPMVQTILVRRIVLLFVNSLLPDHAGQELAGIGTIGLERQRLRRADGNNPAAL